MHKTWDVGGWPIHLQSIYPCQLDSADFQRFHFCYWLNWSFYSAYKQQQQSLAPALARLRIASLLAVFLTALLACGLNICVKFQKLMYKSQTCPGLVAPWARLWMTYPSLAGLGWTCGLSLHFAYQHWCKFLFSTSSRKRTSWGGLGVRAHSWIPEADFKLFWNPNLKLVSDPKCEYANTLMWCILKYWDV